jgi:hypothetical protein
MGTVSVPMATTALSALELGVNYPYIDGVGGCHEVLVLRAQRTAARTCCRRRWYSRPERSWVVRMVDALGNQIGEATYVHGKAEALAEERRMKGELS